MSQETTFQQDVGQWQTIAKTLADLTRKVVLGLREERFRAQTMTVKIRFSDFQALTLSISRAWGSDSKEEIRKAAFVCLKPIKLNKRVRLIGIRLTHQNKVSSASVE
jgi:DNA polymerase IV